MTVMLYRLFLPLSFEWEALVSAFYWENLNRRGLNGVISLAASLGVHHETQDQEACYLVLHLCSFLLYRKIDQRLGEWRLGLLFVFLFVWSDFFFFSPLKTNIGKVFVRMSLDYNLLWPLMVTHELTLPLSWLGRLMSFSEVAIPVHIYTMIYFTLPPPIVIRDNHPFSS